MAQLKSTSVTGNLSVTGNVVASQIIKNNGTEDELLLANGETTSLNAINTGISTAQTTANTANANADTRVLKIGDIMAGTLQFDQSGTYTDSYAIDAGSKYIKAGWLYHTSGNVNTSDFDSICVNKNNWIYYRTKREFIQDLSLSLVYNYKGTKLTLADLKAITSAEIGDVYFILETGDNWACKQKVTAATGDNYTTYWSDLGKNVDLSGYMTLDTNQTITGVKTFTNNLLLAENASSIITRSAAEEWTAGIYSNTIGDEVLGILVKNPKTHIMLGLGDAKARPAETDLTPAIDIQNNKVGINKRLEIDDTDDVVDYNLDVNGSLNTVSMTLDTSATFTYNSTDKCIDVLFN